MVRSRYSVRLFQSGAPNQLNERYGDFSLVTLWLCWGIRRGRANRKRKLGSASTWKKSRFARNLVSVIAVPGLRRGEYKRVNGKNLEYPRCGRRASKPLLMGYVVGEIETSMASGIPLCEAGFRVLDSGSPFTHPSVVPPWRRSLVQSDSHWRPVCW